MATKTNKVVPANQPVVPSTIPTAKNKKKKFVFTRMILNIIIICLLAAIFGTLIYILARRKKLIDSSVNDAINAVNNNPDLQPMLTHYGIDTTLQILNNKEVQDKFNKIAINIVKSPDFQKSISDDAGGIAGSIAGNIANNAKNAGSNIVKNLVDDAGGSMTGTDKINVGQQADQKDKNTVDTTARANATDIKQIATTEKNDEQRERSAWNAV